MTERCVSLTNSHTLRSSLDLELGKSRLLLQKERLMRSEAKCRYTEDRKLIVYDSNAEMVYANYATHLNIQSNKEKRLLMQQLLLQKKGIWEKRRLKVETEHSPEELEELYKARLKYQQKFIPEYKTKGQLLIPKEVDITFSSKFECGNLQRVVLVGDNEYDLYLHPDYGTKNFSQWFYFCIHNKKKDLKIRFNIKGLKKSKVSYVNGMLPAVWSKAKQKHEGIKWHNAGENIIYQKSLSSDTDTEFTLSFSYTFAYANDCVYFAHSTPYSYSKLEGFLNKLKNKTEFKHILAIKRLCYTFALNKCFYLKITDNKREKPSIVITGRVHPGESSSSYVVEGLIKFLLSSDARAKKLRSSFIFYIIPMLNPDGVIFGNYRCSITGTDLNRNWINPSKILQPTIYYTKKLIQTLNNKQRLISFCDFHSHSSNKNVFLLGCQSMFNESEYQEKNKRIKLFARILAKITPHFSFGDSKFGIEKNKLSTGRIVIYKEFNVLQSYTLEISIHCSEQLAKPTDSSLKENKKSSVHFSIQDLFDIGKNVALAYFMQAMVIKKELRERLPDRKQIEEIVEQTNKQYLMSKKISQYKQINVKTSNNVRNEKQFITFESDPQKVHDDYKINMQYVKEDQKTESSLPLINKQTSLLTVIHVPLVKFIYNEIKQEEDRKTVKKGDKLLKQSLNIVFDKVVLEKKFLRSRKTGSSANNRKNLRAGMSLEKYAKPFNSIQSQIRCDNYTLRSRKELGIHSVIGNYDKEGVYKSMNIQLKLRKRKLHLEQEDVNKAYTNEIYESRNPFPSLEESNSMHNCMIKIKRIINDLKKKTTF